MKKLRKLVLTMMVVCLFGSMAACGNRNGMRKILRKTEQEVTILPIRMTQTIRITQMTKITVPQITTRIIVTIPQTMEIMATVW